MFISMLGHGAPIRIIRHLVRCPTHTSEALLCSRRPHATDSELDHLQPGRLALTVSTNAIVAHRPQTDTSLDLGNRLNRVDRAEGRRARIARNPCARNRIVWPAVNATQWCACTQPTHRPRYANVTMIE